MKNITNKEFNEIVTCKKSDPVYYQIKNLGIGEIVVIEDTDWTRSYSPHSSVATISRHYKKKFIIKTMENKKGWAIKRIL